MKKGFFKLLAKLNKTLLPSYTKQRLDLSKASKLQLVIIGWRAYVTKKTVGFTKLSQHKHMTQLKELAKMPI